MQTHLFHTTYLATKSSKKNLTKNEAWNSWPCHDLVRQAELYELKVMNFNICEI